MSFSSFRMGMGLRSMRSGSFSTLGSGGLRKLKSGGCVSGRPSSKSGLPAGGSSIQSILSGLPGSDVSDISGVSAKADSALTKDYVGALEAQAKEDAGAGVYGKDGKASQLRDAQMKQYVSPDRDAAIAQASKLLSGGGLVSAKTKLSGLPYTMSVTKNRSGITAELYDEYGEKFASYNGKTGKWASVDTKAEAQFKTASSSIYDAAYRAAQSKTGGKTDSGASTGLNLHV